MLCLPLPEVLGYMGWLPIIVSSNLLLPQCSITSQSDSPPLAIDAALQFTMDSAQEHNAHSLQHRFVRVDSTICIIRTLYQGVWDQYKCSTSPVARLSDHVSQVAAAWFHKPLGGSSGLRSCKNIKSRLTFKCNHGAPLQHTNDKQDAFLQFGENLYLHLQSSRNAKADWRRRSQWRRCSTLQGIRLCNGRESLLQEAMLRSALQHKKPQPCST